MLGDALALTDGVCQPKMDFGVTPSSIMSFACNSSLPQPQVCICTPKDEYMQPWLHRSSVDGMITVGSGVGLMLPLGDPRTIG